MLKLSTKLALAAAAGLALAGCTHHETDPKMDGHFKAENVERSPVEFAEAQAAAGAREDGMLYERHFDGDQLNSLGRAKLELMAERDDATSPLVVHMATKDEKLTTKRREVVTNFLKD